MAESHNSGMPPGLVGLAWWRGRRRQGYPSEVVKPEPAPRAAAPWPGPATPRSDPAAVPPLAATAEPHPGAVSYRQARFRPPPGATELLLIRHGESAAAFMEEPFPLVDGHADPDLSPEGHEQAERLADRLAKRSET